MFWKTLGIATGAGALLGLGAWYVESTAQAAEGGGGGPVPQGGGGGSTFQPTQTTGGGATPPAPFVTAPDGPTQYTVTTAQTGTAGMLKVRSGPGTGYGQVGVLNHGDTVSASGRTAAGAGSSSGWAELIVSGALTGWASTDYLSPTSPDVVPLAMKGMAAVEQIRALYGPRGIAAMHMVLNRRRNVVG